MIEILPDSAYHNLHVTVLPGFEGGIGDYLASKRWCVIGHYHPGSVTREAIDNLVKDFFAHYKDTIDALLSKEDLHDYDVWRDQAEERFLAFASHYGYTVFRPCEVNTICD